MPKLIRTLYTVAGKLCRKHGSITSHSIDPKTRSLSRELRLKQSDLATPFLSPASSVSRYMLFLICGAANDPSVFTITWWKAPTTNFTFKTPVRHYAKQAPKHGK